MELNEEDIRKIRKVLLAHIVKLEDKCSKLFIDCLRLPESEVCKREYEHFKHQCDEYLELYNKLI